jgi:hypothetical protein
MEQLVIALFFVFFVCEFLVESILNELNIRYIRARWSARDIPEFIAGRIDADDYNKSVHYTLAKGIFQRYSEIYGRVVTLVVLFGGLLPFCDRLANHVGGALPWLPYADATYFFVSASPWFTRSPTCP